MDSAGGGTTGVINVRSAPYNAQLNGVTDDTAAFKAAYQAAAPGSVIYVPNGVTVLQTPPNWGIPLTKRVKWIVDGTTLPDGTPLANAIPGGGSPASNYLAWDRRRQQRRSAPKSRRTVRSPPTSRLPIRPTSSTTPAAQPAARSSQTRATTRSYTTAPAISSGVASTDCYGAARKLRAALLPPSTSGATCRRSGRMFSLDSSGKPLPQPNLWAACLEYRDITGQPSSMAASSITVEMDWFGNGPDDGNQRQIQSLVVGQHNTSGAPVEISTIIGVYLAAGCTGHAYRVFNVNIPFSTSVLDTTNAQQMAGAAAIRMAAGHAIAFEPTNSCRLAYDSTTNTLRWNQGSILLSCRQGHLGRLVRPSMPAVRHCRTTCPAIWSFWSAALALHDHTSCSDQRRGRNRIHILGARFGTM